MDRNATISSALVLRLILGLALLGWPTMGGAAGTWSVIATPGDALGQVDGPSALAVDSADSLYVADEPALGLYAGRLQKRDAQGHWSVIATGGTDLGQVNYPSALAVDTVGNLYVADAGVGIQKQDAKGNWSVIDAGTDSSPYTALAVDIAGNLYVAEGGRPCYVDASGYASDWHARIQKRDIQENWSLIAACGEVPGLTKFVYGLAADVAGNLYVADFGRIQKRDVPENWSILASEGTDLGQVTGNPSALAMDAVGNLYVADSGNGRIQKRDAQGHWSVIATEGSALGQINLGDYSKLGLAVDSAGNLYVADTGNNRVLKYTPAP